MGGWKTKLGAAGVICTGVGMVIGGFVAEPMDGQMIGAGLIMIFGALEGVGIAHKIEKTKQ